jgi:hypothetical protein
MSGLSPDRTSFPFGRQGQHSPMHIGQSHFSFSSKGSCMETTADRPISPLTPHRQAPRAPVRQGPKPVRHHEKTPSATMRAPYTRTNTDDSMLTVDSRQVNQRLYDRRLRDGGMIPLQLIPPAPTAQPTQPDEPDVRPRPARLAQIRGNPLVTLAIATVGGGCFVLACLTVANTVQLHAFGQALMNSSLIGAFGGQADRLPVYR